MIGEKLGKYTILASIGTGSMGTVYRAEDPTNQRAVAIKLIRSNILYDMDRRERFLQGILAASGISHPGIAPILEIGDEGDDFYVITPFFKGDTLAHLIQGHSLQWRQALRIAISIAEAVAAVHSCDAVHRALKPSNVWILEDQSVILTDCCIARFTEIERAPKHTDPSGRKRSADTIIPMSALAYMSPEQIRGQDVDFRSDIFSLGVILYEMLTGRHPFEARNSFSRMSAIVEAQPASLASRKLAVPSKLEAILQRSLAKQPCERYQDSEEMLADLRVVCAGAADVEELPISPSLQERRILASPRFWIPAALFLIATAAAFYYTMLR